MLDRDDEQIILDAKSGCAVLVTWDRVLREAAGGMTPYEAMDKAISEGNGTEEAKGEVNRLRSLSPSELTSMAEAGNKTVELFRQKIKVNELGAKMIRILRVEKEYSWRAIARHCSRTLKAPFGSNQVAGMVICEKAAKALGENFMEPPWN